MIKRYTDKKNKKYKKGFTLVELLVVTSIFFIITGVVLFRQAKFSSDILITNTAYEVALFIREAQVFGVGSKLATDDTGDALGRVAYGVNINTGDLSSLTMFSDVPDDGNFDFIYNDEEDVNVNTLSFSREQKISKFCIDDGSGEDQQCSSELTELNIAFIKPDLNAQINASDGFNTVSGSSATIYVISSLKDKCRKVVVNSVGQIAVEVAEISECE